MLVNTRVTFKPLKPRTLVSLPKTDPVLKPEIRPTQLHVGGKILSVPIGEKAVSIGRHSDSDIRLPVLQVSRRHAEMKKVDGEIFLRDLGSSNGTYVNGKPIPQGEWTKVDEKSHLSFSVQPEGALGFRPMDSTKEDQDLEARSEKGLTLRLPAEGTTLLWGRSSELEDSLPESPETRSVSRRHLLVRKNGGSFWVKDLDSSYGTSVGSPPRKVVPGKWTEVPTGEALILGGKLKLDIRPKEG